MTSGSHGKPYNNLGTSWGCVRTDYGRGHSLAIVLIKPSSRGVNKRLADNLYKSLKRIFDECVFSGSFLIRPRTLAGRASVTLGVVIIRGLPSPEH
jgi:hypothetical protein